MPPHRAKPCWLALPFALVTLLAPRAASAPVDPGKRPLPVLRSDRLPDPVTFTDGGKVRVVTGFVLRLDSLASGEGKGTLTLEEDALTFNDFGDATGTTTREARYNVQLRLARPAGGTGGRVLYDMIFADGLLKDRLRFAGHPRSANPLLLVRPQEEKGRQDL